MEEKSSMNFLPLFINEPIYVVDEPAPFFTETVPQQKEPVEPIVEKIPIMGDNHKHILVLVAEDQVEFISQPDQILLHNILKAMHLSPQDIALVNLRNIPFDSTLFPKLLESIPFRTLLSFGALVADWSVCNFFSKYTVKTDDANRKLLLADRLSELANDPQKKKRLWLCLQQLFVG